MKDPRPRWLPDDCPCGWSPPVYPVRDWECDDPDPDCPHHGNPTPLQLEPPTEENTTP